MFVTLHTAERTVVFMPGDTPGQRLKQLREQLGLSLRDAARLADGISYSTIKASEDRVGSWDKVELATIKAFARLYNMALDKFIAFVFQDDAPDIAKQVLEAIERHGVHPKWHALPTYDSVDAGDMTSATPLEDDVAYIPKKHLARRGVEVDNVRVFTVSGSCMVSQEATRAEKNFAPGDYVAVDINRAPDIGETVVAWSAEHQTLIIKRYAIDRGQLVLHPLNRGRPTVVVNEDNVTLLGPVVWRGG